MATTNTSAELGVVLYNLDERGLDEFESEAQRAGPQWLRVPGPSASDLLRWEPYVAPARRPSWPFAVPVVLAAAVAGAVVSWVGMRASERVQPPVVRAAPAGDAVAAEPVVKITPTVPAVPSPQRASEPAASGDVAPASVEAPAAVDPAFEQTLAAVSASYRTLDATALTGVWPGADTASLAERFSALKYQSLTFDRCQVRTTGAAGALASCDVSIAAALKSGEPSLQRRRESWTLVLDRSGDRWTIAGVSVQ
jgi:hypothetical protein